VCRVRERGTAAGEGGRAAGNADEGEVAAGATAIGRAQRIAEGKRAGGRIGADGVGGKGGAVGRGEGDAGATAVGEPAGPNGHAGGAAERHAGRRRIWGLDGREEGGGAGGEHGGQANRALQGGEGREVPVAGRVRIDAALARTHALGAVWVGWGLLRRHPREQRKKESEKMGIGRGEGKCYVYQFAHALGTRHLRRDELVSDRSSRRSPVVSI
jgi:hypothetical protein